MIDPGRFLEDVSGRYARPYAAVVHDLLVATLRGNKSQAFDARTQLAAVTRETMGVGEVLGATIMLRAAAGVMRQMGVVLAADRIRMLTFEASPDQNILPRVTFQDALQDMIDRTPVTIRNAAERTAQRIAQLYSEGTNMAFVRAAEESVTAHAKEFLQRAFREGLSENAAGKGLVEDLGQLRDMTEPWSQGYSRMVFRTNLNTAVSAGRFRQAQDQDIRAVVPAFRFDAIGDGDTRDNHAAADGIILRVDNPAWNKIAPPLGYNCRCEVHHVPLPELEALGRYVRGRVIESSIPPGAFPDEGFRHGGRPDLMLAGVG